MKTQRDTSSSNALVVEGQVLAAKVVLDCMATKVRGVLHLFKNFFKYPFQNWGIITKNKSQYWLVFPYDYC